MIAVSSKFTKTLAVFGAMGFSFCSSANAQNASDLFYENLDSTTNAEAASFVQMYVQFLETGIPAPGADTFVYSNPDANSPLFSPYVGYARTLAGIHAKGKQYIGNDVTPAMIANFAANSTIVTSISDSEQTVNHLVAVSESETTVGVVVENSNLVSSGVLTTAVASSASPFVSPEPAPSPTIWMADLANYSTLLASNFNPADDIQRMLLGEPTNAEALSDGILEWMEAFVPEDQELDTELIHASFGKFGALPVIVINYEDGYLLANGMTGSISGPYLYADEIDSGVFLDTTPQYIATTSFNNVSGSVNSVGILVAKRFSDTMPAGYALTPPGSCGFPTTIPGCWQPTGNYECQPRPATQKCICTAAGSISKAGSPNGTVEITCVYPVGPDGECETNAVPPTAIPGATCTTRYKLPR